MQPLKKFFNLHNQKVRNHSQQNPAKATAQCLALAVLTEEEVSEYSDWLTDGGLSYLFIFNAKYPTERDFKLPS